MRQTGAGARGVWWWLVGGGLPEGLTGRRVRQTIRQRAGGRQETDSRAA